MTARTCASAPIVSVRRSRPSSSRPVTDARNIPEADLRGAQFLWATIDSPWVHTADPARYQKTVDAMHTIDPEFILSTHLPPAIGLSTQLFEMLSLAPGADPFVGPDQQALEAMLASFEPAAA